MFFQCVGEVFHVMHGRNFYAEVVNHQAECDITPDVAPGTSCVLALVVPFGGKALFK